MVLEIQSESDVEAIALNAWDEKDKEHSGGAMLLIKRDVVAPDNFGDLKSSTSSLTLLKDSYQSTLTTPRVCEHGHLKNCPHGCL